MKQCPTCGATYPDDSQSFCLNDGSVLVPASHSQDSSATLVYNQPQTAPNPQTAGFNSVTQTFQQPGWTSPNSTAVIPGRPQRSLMPWLLGCGGVLLLAMVGLGLVFGIAMLNGRSKESSSENTGTVDNNSSNKANNNGRKESDTTSNVSNANQTLAEASPSPPFAEFANRTGRYDGTATNTTFNPPTSGTMRIDITTINSNSGYVAMMIRSGGNLCGDGPASGKINEAGLMNMTGKLSCNGITFPMAARCQFSTSNTFSCSYTLTSPPGYTPAIQHGTMQVSKH